MYNVDMWCWLKTHDLPNWLAAVFGLFVWPTIIIVWNRRTVHSVRGLEVSVSPGNVKIGSTDYPAIDVRFINSTGSIVYVTGPRVRINSKTLRVPKEADRDIAQGALYFAAFDDDTNPSGEANVREFTLQTNRRRHGAIALIEVLPDDFYAHTAPRWRRILRRPKYFRLEYTAMVGRKLHSIATIY